MTTATGPTARSVLRTARGPVGFVLVVVLLATGMALAAGQRRTGALDPRSYSPAGTRALAQVLQGLGTTVQVVGSVDEVPADTPLVLPFPTVMDATQLDDARSVGGPLLVVEPDPVALAALSLDLQVTRSEPEKVRAPGCSDPVAVRAGTARVGGTRFTADGCYDDSLVTRDEVTVIGSSAFLTNEHLAEDGNAALALGLLDGAPTVMWLIPSAGSGGQQKGLLDLLPDWVTSAALQLAVAVVVLALWRARRLGRVVPEPLPVVVRAAEAVEGRGRLYRSARARDRAAEALRSASRDAAVRRLALGPAAAAEVVVEAAATRTGRSSADVHALLYGPPPADDAALLRLAHDLTRFDTEVSSQ